MSTAPKKNTLRAIAQKVTRSFSSLKKIVRSVFSKSSDTKKNTGNQPTYQLRQIPDIMISDEESGDEDWDVIYHDELANNSANGDERGNVEELLFAAREHQDLVGSRRFVN
ncbi:hypothetical protein F53441_5739 [Fusarium austroafricanum]|uniref:Uncharacterized protein n=1 Tax=Fusarium austroafricanum TaxID=2364996 RepID=A0A8H4KJ67_9HYPO|nr:hypothetical protein F53441_5739 [Fusarium austroafricanum]